MTPAADRALVRAWIATWLPSSTDSVMMALPVGEYTAAALSRLAAEPELSEKSIPFSDRRTPEQVAEAQVGQPQGKPVIPSLRAALARAGERAVLDAQWEGNKMTYREALCECADAFERAVANKLIGRIVLEGPGGRVSVYAGMGGMIRDFLEAADAARTAVAPAPKEDPDR